MKTFRKVYTIAIVLLFFIAFVEVASDVMCSLVPKAYPEGVCKK